MKIIDVQNIVYDVLSFTYKLRKKNMYLLIAAVYRFLKYDPIHRRLRQGRSVEPMNPRSA